MEITGSAIIQCLATAATASSTPLSLLVSKKLYNLTHMERRRMFSLYFFLVFNKYVKAGLWHYIKWFGCATLAARFRKEIKCLSIPIGFKVPTVYPNSV